MSAAFDAELSKLTVSELLAENRAVASVALAEASPALSYP